MFLTFEFLKSYSAARNGVMPSFAEIAAHIGVKSKSNVSRIVEALCVRGVIKHNGGARGFEIVGADAVLAERERCARVADAFAEHCQQRMDSAIDSTGEDEGRGGATTAREIAEAIRRST